MSALSDMQDRSTAVTTARTAARAALATAYSTAPNPTGIDHLIEKCAKLTFQNLERATEALTSLFGVDLPALVADDEWRLLEIGFMRRHLLAHRAGVVDQRYLDQTGDTEAVLGRRLDISATHVRRLAGATGKLGRELADAVSRIIPK